MIGGSPHSNNTLTAHDLKRIALALGGHPDGKGWRARCPAHEGVDRNLSIWIQDGLLGLKCWSHNCPRRHILYAMIDRGLLPDFRGYRGVYRTRAMNERPAQVRAPVVNDNSRFARRIWDESIPVGESKLAKTYFECRPGGLGVPASCTELRFHPRCPRRAERLPAIVGRIVCALSGQFRAIHRIFLTADGRDRLRDGHDKLSLGRTIGGVVCLNPYNSVGQSLVLTQSVEDGLVCLAAGCLPCWAAPGDTIMASFPVLPRLVGGLTVVCDNDESGLKAAEKVLERYRQAGVPAVSVAPPNHKDANELWGALHAQR
jgi:hypothetical protein